MHLSDVRTRFQSRRRRRMVAIVVPLSMRPELLPDEELSLRHLCHYLGAYDKYLIAPAGTRVTRHGFVTRYVPRKFFGSTAAYNSLTFWPPYYRGFQDYEFILVHHLDSLVFSDELVRWCRAGFDYIGAPWLPGPDTPWVREPRVGNGGFTLMRIDSVLQVLENRRRQEPLSQLTDFVARNERRVLSPFRILEAAQRRLGSPFIERVLERQRLAQDVLRYANDYFWSFKAVEYLPTFRVAGVEDGLRFAFETYPRTCFELNGRRLPFGCHAWTKFDRAFWEPFLLRDTSAGA